MLDHVPLDSSVVPFLAVHIMLVKPLPQTASGSAKVMVGCVGTAGKVTVSPPIPSQALIAGAVFTVRVPQLGMLPVGATPPQVMPDGVGV